MAVFGMAIHRVEYIPGRFEVRMTQADNDHFDRYLVQTAVKHEILKKYIKSFYSILKSNHKNLVYFDGFSGCGEYDDGDSAAPGSPIIALDVISADDVLRKSVLPVFVEARKKHSAALKARISDHDGAKSLKNPPIVVNASCTDAIRGLVESLDGAQLAPTFLFVDPCGVQGVSLPEICSILKRPWCELFLFLNYDGLNRIFGLYEKTGRSETLEEFFGAEGTKEMAEILASASNREVALVEYVTKFLREQGQAQYVLRFRVEDRKKKRTSHYLIHATKHELGFKIMKDVMYEAGRLEGESIGRLELLQSSVSDGQLFLLRDDLQRIQEFVLRELRETPRTVGYFSDECVKRADDYYSTSAYKKILKKLEREGVIDVLDKDRATPRPAARRQKRGGEVTLADHLYVRLSKKPSK